MKRSIILRKTFFIVVILNFFACETDDRLSDSGQPGDSGVDSTTPTHYNSIDDARVETNDEADTNLHDYSCKNGSSVVCQCDDGKNGLRICVSSVWSACTCSESEPIEPVCEPNDIRECTCFGELAGLQSCHNDGSGWDECTCLDAVSCGEGDRLELGDMSVCAEIFRNLLWCCPNDPEALEAKICEVSPIPVSSLTDEACRLFGPSYEGEICESLSGRPECGRVCELGEIRECSCSGSASGMQACRDDLSGWHECSCLETVSCSANDVLELENVPACAEIFKNILQCCPQDEEAVEKQVCETSPVPVSTLTNEICNSIGSSYESQICDILKTRPECGAPNALESDADTPTVYQATPGEQIALRAANDLYVLVWTDPANPNSDGTLLARAPHTKEWETLRRYELGDNKIALMAYTGKYVSLNPSDKRLQAIADKITDLEVFELIEIDSNGKVGLKASNGLYVMAWIDPKNPKANESLLAVSPHLQAWETFLMVDPNAPPPLPLCANEDVKPSEGQSCCSNLRLDDLGRCCAGMNCCDSTNHSTSYVEGQCFCLSGYQWITDDQADFRCELIEQQTSCAESGSRPSDGQDCCSGLKLDERGKCCIGNNCCGAENNSTAIDSITCGCKTGYDWHRSDADDFRCDPIPPPAPEGVDLQVTKCCLTASIEYDDHWGFGTAETFFTVRPCAGESVEVTNFGNRGGGGYIVRFALENRKSGTLYFGTDCYYYDSSLDAGYATVWDSNGWSCSYALNGSIPSGNYDTVCIADDRNDVPEYNENNNYTYSNAYYYH